MLSVFKWDVSVQVEKVWLASFTQKLNLWQKQISSHEQPTVTLYSLCFEDERIGRRAPELLQ